METIVTSTSDQVEIRNMWCDELLSGRYERGNGYLCRQDLSKARPHPLLWCAGGVLVQLADDAGITEPGYWSGVKGLISYRVWNGQNGILPSAVADWAGMARNPGFKVSMAMRKTIRMPKEWINASAQQKLVPLTVLNDQTIMPWGTIVELIATLP